MSLTPLPRPLNKEIAQELREQILTLVLDAIKNVAETDEGFLLDFGRESEDLELINQFLEVERHCNPFLRLHLILESNEGPIKLELSGPSGTKDFLKSEFGLSRWLDT